VYRIAQRKGKTGPVANRHHAAENLFVKLIWGNHAPRPVDSLGNALLQLSMPGNVWLGDLVY
jgi:hypothetical protein